MKAKCTTNINVTNIYMYDILDSFYQSHCKHTVFEIIYNEIY